MLTMEEFWLKMLCDPVFWFLFVGIVLGWTLLNYVFYVVLFENNQEDSDHEH